MRKIVFGSQFGLLITVHCEFGWEGKWRVKNLLRLAVHLIGILLSISILFTFILISFFLFFFLNGKCVFSIFLVLHVEVIASYSSVLILFFM